MLVVIGIFIALQVNNWNTERIGKKEGLNILLGLKDEYEYYLESIKTNLNLNIGTSNASKELTQQVRANKLKDDADTVGSHIYAISDFGSFDAKTGFTDEIINSGKLDLIENDGLRHKLISWPGELFKDLTRISNRHAIIKTFKSPFQANLNKMDPMEFENMIWTHKMNQDYVILNDYKIRIFIQQIPGLINSELNKYYVKTN